jgi:hypothetical protein
MSIDALQSVMEAELNDITALYEEIATASNLASSADFSLENECVLEGVLSRAWQTWNRFCRELIIESCLGTTNLSGPIAGHPSATSIVAVSMAAIRVRRHLMPVWRGANSVLRDEPTWGDVNVLLDLIAGLGPSNATSLNDLCTVAGPGARTLQAVRNATAHTNAQALANLARLSSSYVAFPITHPTHAMFWVSAISGELLFLDALEHMRDAAMGCAL